MYVRKTTDYQSIYAKSTNYIIIGQGEYKYKENMKAGSKGPFRCSSCYVNLYLFLICFSFPFSVHSANVLWIKFIVPICIIKYVCCCVCFLFIKLQICHQIASIAIVWNNKNYGAFSGIIINRYGCIILFIFYYFHRTTGYTSSTLTSKNPNLRYLAGKDIETWAANKKTMSDGEFYNTIKNLAQ